MIERARIATLREYEILDTPKDGAFDHITKLASMILDAPIAIVSFVDTDRIWFKSSFGLSIKEIPKEMGLCASAILGEKFYEVEDALLDDTIRDNSLIKSELGLRFYASIPLKVKNGHNIGTLCVLDKKSRRLSIAQQEMLEHLASLVVEQLELMFSARQALNSELRMTNMLKAIYESTEEACTFIDTDFVIRYNNQVAKNISKQFFGKELQIGDNPLEFVLPEYKEEFKNYYSSVLNGGNIEAEKTDGKKWWRLAIFPVFDSENVLVGIAHNVQDITAKKANILKIFKQKEVLRQIAWQQSHEVREPVANILGLVNLLKTDKALNAKEKEQCLEYLFDTTKILDKIIHKIVKQSIENEYVTEE